MKATPLTRPGSAGAGIPTQPKGKQPRGAEGQRAEGQSAQSGQAGLKGKDTQRGGLVAGLPPLPSHG